jgi:hypothetical protein
LQDVYRDKLALRRRHEAGARAVASYDFNNAYQYVIAREDMHLSWLDSAIQNLGGTAPYDVPPSDVAGRSETDILHDDIRAAQAFVDRWEDRLARVTNARHRLMLGVVLGETREHLRLFSQASEGRSDLLGRRTGGTPTGGRVLADRWLE